MRILRTIIIVLSMFLPGVCFPEELTLTDPAKDHYLRKNNYEILEDFAGELKIEDFLSGHSVYPFQKVNALYPINENPHSSYWIRFKINNNLAEAGQWIIESFNFRINELEIYMPLNSGKYKKVSAGDVNKFSERQVLHKNFIFNLPLDIDESKYFYVRFKNENPTILLLVFRSYSRFASYAINEYYLLGVFYGMLLVIGLYNLFLFISIRDKAYLYYVLYVVCVGLFLMAQDGSGFHYIWPMIPSFNFYSIPTFILLTVIFILLYTKSFLSVKQRLPLWNMLINVFIGIRILTYFLGLFIYKELFDILFIDLIALMLAYLIAIISYKKGYTPARFFILGFTILFSGFAINFLRIHSIIPGTLLTFYSVQIAAIMEMILLSLALADRIRLYRMNQLVKEKVNRELEEKVREKTTALMLQKDIIEEKAKELDTFIYKASHDIKGPLKSIIGLATLGGKDESRSKEYFEHILRSTKRLDNVVMDLLYITKINQSKTIKESSEINFNEIIPEILASLEHLPDYNKIKIELEINQTVPFFSNKSLIYSILQNLIENAINYSDPAKENRFLRIIATFKEDESSIIIEDNGLGIAEEYQEKIFEMFFRVSERGGSSTGLGLYIVKISLEKLGGKLSVWSEEGIGSRFIITF